MTVVLDRWFHELMIVVGLLLGLGPRPGSAAQVIDYGHGQQTDEPRDNVPRNFRFVTEFLCLY